MKKRTAFIAGILSLIPFGQPLLINTGVVLPTLGLLLTVSGKVYAKDSNFFYNRGNLKAKRGDHYAAIVDYTKAIDIDPKNDDAFYNRGNSKIEIKDYYGAIADYTKAIDIDPQYSNAFKNRSISKKNIGDITGACLDAKRALSLGNSLSDNEIWIEENC